MTDTGKADRVVRFINCLKHTKGRFYGKPFELLPWQEKIVRDIFGTVRDENPEIRQYTTAYVEIPKKQGKSELGAALALNMLCNDGEWRAEVYECASDRQQASIIYDVAVDMVKQCPALMKRRSSGIICSSITNSISCCLSHRSFSISVHRLLLFHAYLFRRERLFSFWSFALF